MIENLDNLIRENGSLLTINSKNIIENYKLLEKKVAPSLVAPVLKSNAYGMGLSQVVTILKETSCKNIFVATENEGTIVRKINPEVNIYVLHGIFLNNEDYLFNRNLTPVINSFLQFEKWLNFAKKKETVLPCLLHIDSGINRLGIKEDEIKLILEKYPDYSKYLNIKYTMSHFACSEDSKSPNNELQYQVFQKLSNYFPKSKKSIAASYAIYTDNKYHLNMVRPGFALYGSNPVPLSKNPVLKVLDFYTTILKINKIKKGESTGYGYIWTAQKNSTIATISLGYTDGILRSTSKGSVYIKGRKAPIIGRISMDLITIDISHLDDINIKEGDIVEMIGDNQTIDDFANMTGTIQCEALNLLTRRYRRIYY